MSVHDGHSPLVSLRQALRIVAEPKFSVVQGLLTAAEQVGHQNISHGSRINRAVVVFVWEERLVQLLVEKDLVLEDQYILVTPLYLGAITVSGVPRSSSISCLRKS